MGFQFYVVSPKDLNRFSNEAVTISNKAFSFWEAAWSKIYADNGAASAFKIDEFYRQDIVGVIERDGEVMAMWANSFFNVNSLASLRHSYFKFYDQTYLSWLEKNEIEDVMSFEFFTVAPTARESAFGPSIGRTLAFLAAELLKQSNAQALIAPARIDVGVTRLAYEIGFEQVVGNTVQRGFPCDLIALRKTRVRETSNKESALFARGLWNNRIDLTQKIEIEKRQAA